MIRVLLGLAAGSAVRGRDAVTRTVLVAVAAGFAVALLLLAVSVPGALAARSVRSDARTAVLADDGHPARLQVSEVSIGIGDGAAGLVVARPSGRAPLPPGVTALPPSGAMLVSPALRAALAGPDGALLRARLPYRITGTIAPAGLLGPSEERFVAVVPRLAAGGATEAVHGFGERSTPEPLDPILSLLVIVGVLLLLVPIGIVVAVTGRFGAERRDRRLAALRLLGLSSRSVLGLALVETAIAAAAGDLLGVAVFALARQAIGGFTVADLSVYPADVAPAPLLVALVLVAVPVLLGATALASLAALRIEPLGVVRRGARRRRIGWRLAPIALALLLLAGGVTNLGGTAGIGLWLVALGIALLLIGSVALLPWITERIAGAVAAGPLAWQVAMRRVRHDGTTSGRIVGAVTAVVAGAIALQLLLAGLAGSYTTTTGGATSGTQVRSVALRSGAAARMLALLGTSGGVALAESDLPVHGHPDDTVSVLTGTCASLDRVASLPGCHDGATYLSAGGGARSGVVLDAAGRWALPARSPDVPLRTLPDGGTEDGAILVTPAALPLDRQGLVTVGTVVPAGDAGLPPLVRAATAIDPALDIETMSPTALSHRFDSIRRGLGVGLVLVLLLIGLVLLVSVGEQLRERRRPLAVLAVLGLPRGVLVCAVLAESALPVAVGAVVAGITGAALGSALLAIVGRPGLPDPGIVLTTPAVALLVPLLVTAATLPAVLRLLSPEHLRAE